MSMCVSQEQLIQLHLEKPLSGGLGFSVIGGERGIFVKSITPGGVAHTSGELQVGDRLLKVSYVLLCSIMSKCNLSLTDSSGPFLLTRVSNPDTF